MLGKKMQALVGKPVAGLNVQDSVHSASDMAHNSPVMSVLHLREIIKCQVSSRRCSHKIARDFPAC